MRRRDTDLRPCDPVRIDADHVRLSWRLVHRAMARTATCDRDGYEHVRNGHPEVALPEWDAIALPLDAA